MTIAAFAISTMPFAASVTDSPSGSAHRSSIARRAPSTSRPISPPRKYVGLSRPRTTFASVTVGSVPPVPVADRAGIGARAPRADAEHPARVDPRDRAAAGADLDEVDDRACAPGSRRATCRRLRRRRGRRRRSPSSRTVVRPGSGPTLAVVPPMSKDRMSGRPSVSPRWAEAITPAAGPDSTMNTGRTAAASEPKMPPLDCITSSLAAHTRVGQPLLDPLQVALHHRSDHRVDHGRRRAEVLADLRRDLRRERDGDRRAAPRRGSLRRAARARSLT